MPRPVIGIIGNAHVVGDTYPTHAAGTLNSAAVARVADCLPLIVPADPDMAPVADLMATCDGFMFTGGRPNVHPSHYGQAATPAHGDFDRPRDALVLPLIRACVDAGQPILAICRGFQEVNVAFGGTLHAEVRDLPGRQNHRMPTDGDLAHKFTNCHEVSFVDGSPFHRLYGARSVVTNSLHGQAIDRPGGRIVIDGTAPDGTAEAFHVEGAAGFALAVQWHPEWNAAEDPVSRPLFAAFGDAARDWAAGRRSDARRLSA